MDSSSGSIARVGKPGPLFCGPVARSGEAPSAPVSTVSLSDYRGKRLVFFWYPADFSFVCPTEITALSERYDDFLERDTDVLGASTDSVYAHRAWLRTAREANGIAGVRFPLLADQTLHVARDWGVLIAEQGIALRATFIVDPDGLVQYAVTHNLNIGRSVDETLRVLDGLQAGGLCPSDWKPGAKMLEVGTQA